MIMDVIELRDFYGSKLGRASTVSLTMALSSIWRASPSERLLGCGYAVPFVDQFAGEVERAYHFMPARQGAMAWPDPKLPASALVYDDELPLLDGSVDRLMMVHWLEHSESAEDALSEAWRVLSPGGTLVLIVPNRRGVWARFEHTPFGTGKPYSRGQLARLLKEARFTPEGWADALHFPPSNRDFMLRIHRGVERFGRGFWPVFAGAICVAASKQLYQGIPVTARVRRRAAIPVLVPQGSGRNSD